MQFERKTLRALGKIIRVLNNNSSIMIISLNVVRQDSCRYCPILKSVSNYYTIYVMFAFFFFVRYKTTNNVKDR